MTDQHPSLSCDASSRPELVLLTGHTAPVLGAAFSPDGRLLATSGQDGQVILWDTATAAVRRLWRRRFISQWIAFAPSGELAMIAGPGVGLWNVETGEWQGTFPNADGPMVFPPAGQRLVAMDRESFLVLDSASGQLLRRVLLGFRLYVFPPTAAISLDGSTAAVGSYEDRGYRLRVLDLASGELKLLRRIPSTILAKARDPNTGRLKATHGAQGDVEVLALSPDGRRLAVGGTFTLWLCDVKTGRRTHLLLCGCDGPRSLAFSSDGTLLAAGTSGGSVIVWRVPSARPVLSCRGHTSWVSAVAFSSDGRFLASGSHDKSVCIWRLDTDECSSRSFPALAFEASGVAYSPDGATIAVSYSDGTVRLWNARTGSLERILIGKQSPDGSLLFSPDGTTLATGTEPTAGIWDTRTGEVLRPAAEQAEPVSACGEHTREATSPDHQTRAVSRGWGGEIKLERNDTGEVLHTLSDPEEEDMVVSLVFSPDGRTLAAGYGGFRVRLWDVATGKLVQLLRTHEDSISSLAFSPDGGLLAVGGDYGTVVVLCNLRAVSGPVRVVLTRVEHLRELAEYLEAKPEEISDADVTLESHTDSIRGVAFAPDGRRVATVGADAALKLWDTRSGHLLATFLPLPSLEASPPADWITHTPDGYYLSSPEAAPYIRWQVGTELQEGTSDTEGSGRAERVASRLA